MQNEETDIIMAKYLENRTTEAETQIVLNRLIASERERRIMELASAGYRCIKPDMG